MKIIPFFISILLGSLFIFQSSTANSAVINLRIEGQKAKNIYNWLSGSSVHNEGAAGHLYRKGKDVLCRYTDVDMTDKHGNPISMYDPRRYACTIKFNHNGYAFPGNNP